ncbi:MAG: single-stranded DNA-binding protein [Spirochaetales bacterium]|nr:single-stranded DNA-binding protein [Spirochaetales bacterium]
MDGTALALVRAAKKLNRCLAGQDFGSPVACVYNPLEYAWNAYRSYLERFAGTGGAGGKRVLLLGMNPGPWGMAQTGVPFGEIQAVRDWMGIEQPVGHPPVEHPRRPVQGFAVARSEASGRRLWGLVRERFGTAECFFREHFVGNYCPLLFLDPEGKNLTPDKLPSGERQALFDCCDEHLRATILALDPHWLIGIGRFTERRLRAVQADLGEGDSGNRERKVAGILHPSPASPAANRDWAGATAERLISLGVW